MLRRVRCGVLWAIPAYLVGAFGGGFLVSLLSSNTHDRSIEAAMTGAFVLGPLAAAIVHLLLSPKREFAADAAAAAVCGSPHGLADALLRLERAAELVEFRASPTTEPLYTFNPFAEEGLARMFVTHPPVGERIRRLRSLDPDWSEKLRAA